MVNKYVKIIMSTGTCLTSASLLYSVQIIINHISGKTGLCHNVLLNTDVVFREEISHGNCTISADTRLSIGTRKRCSVWIGTMCGSLTSSQPASHSGMIDMKKDNYIISTYIWLFPNVLF